MKRLLLFAALFLMGVSLFAKGALAVEAFIGTGTVEDNGGAIREREMKGKKGDRKGTTLYYEIGSEWQTVRIAVTAQKATFTFRASQGGSYECKSFTVNGKELLTSPISILRSGKKKQENFKVESENGKMELVLQVRRTENAK